MIFIALGTQKSQFNRLLRAVDDLVEQGIITEPVFAQTGSSDYVPRHYAAQAFMDHEAFEQKLEEAELIITHGGTGTIMSAVKKGKKVIAVPRKKEFGEHVNDHQSQIVRQFAQAQIICACEDCSRLDQAIAEARAREFQPYTSNTQAIIEDIDAYISNLPDQKPGRLKQRIKMMRSRLWGIGCRLRWEISGSKRKRDGLNHERRENPLIVTLTTFPGRIHIVHRTVRTLLDQKGVRPDAVELWLSAEEFPRGESELPEKLRQLTAYGLSIRWCGSLRSYKKLVPALKAHPDAILVTADDDAYYSRRWLRKLYTAWQQDPQNIHCHKATLFYETGGRYDRRPGGKYYYHYPAYRNELVGVGGVLYPPGALHPDAVREDLFLKLAPTNDDLWFWFMAVRNGWRISVVPKNRPRPIAVIGSYTTQSLETVNNAGPQLLWKDFDRLLAAFPEVGERFLAEGNDPACASSI